MIFLQRNVITNAKYLSTEPGIYRMLSVFAWFLHSCLYQNYVISISYVWSLKIFVAQIDSSWLLVSLLRNDVEQKRRRKPAAIFKELHKTITKIETVWKPKLSPRNVMYFYSYNQVWEPWYPPTLLRKIDLLGLISLSSSDIGSCLQEVGTIVDEYVYLIPLSPHPMSLRSCRLFPPITSSKADMPRA